MFGFTAPSGTSPQRINFRAKKRIFLLSEISGLKKPEKTENLNVTNHNHSLVGVLKGRTSEADYKRHLREKHR